MRYGFITFNPHLNDQHLNKEFISLLQVTLSSAFQYLVVMEKEGSIKEHVHVILSYDVESFDRSNVCSSFKKKPFKLFYQRIVNENLHTEIDPAFNNKCLQCKIVQNTIHDYQKSLGYLFKENGVVLNNKGYSQSYLQKCTEYYWTNARNEASKKKDNSWIILNSRNFHSITSEFCKNHEISLDDPDLLLRLLEEKIEINDLPQKKRDQFIASLNLCENKEKTFLSKNSQTHYEKIVKGENHVNEMVDEITFVYGRLNKEKSINKYLCSLLEKYGHTVPTDDQCLTALHNEKKA